MDCRNHATRNRMPFNRLAVALHKFEMWGACSVGGEFQCGRSLAGGGLSSGKRVGQPSVWTNRVGEDRGSTSYALSSRFRSTSFPFQFGQTFSQLLYLLAERRRLGQQFPEATQAVRNRGVRSLAEVVADEFERSAGQFLRQKHRALTRDDQTLMPRARAEVARFDAELVRDHCGDGVQ